MENRLQDTLDRIKQVKKTCLLCKEYRQLHESHLIPKSFIKTNDVILLCPSHHQYFDNGVLNRKEKDTIKPLFIECISKYYKELEYRFSQQKPNVISFGTSKIKGFLIMLDYCRKELNI